MPILSDQKLMDLLEIGLDGVTVMIDPSLPPGHAEKYKVAFYANASGTLAA